MPNGKNAGRLFSDCTNEHGYGIYHAVPKTAKPGETVACVHCGTLVLVLDDDTAMAVEKPEEES